MLNWQRVHFRRALELAKTNNKNDLAEEIIQMAEVFGKISKTS